MQINLLNKSCAILVILCFVILLQGCSNKSELYVFLSLETGEQSLEFVPYEYLLLDMNANELLDIYKKFDEKYESSMSESEISSLVFEREHLLQKTLFEKCSLTTIINFGLPIRVFNSEMSKIDKKLFKNRQTYYAFYDLSSTDLEEADKKKRIK